GILPNTGPSFQRCADEPFGRVAACTYAAPFGLPPVGCPHAARLAPARHAAFCNGSAGSITNGTAFPSPVTSSATFYAIDCVSPPSASPSSAPSASSASSPG